MSNHHHDHAHEEDSYFLDQVCMIALSAAFGSICLGLYFWQTDMLKRMLGSQFHDFVLASGIVLLVLSVIRGAVLWVQVGKTPAHSHSHDHHHHDHAHDHAHDHHDHAHGHHHHETAVAAATHVHGEHPHHEPAAPGSLTQVPAEHHHHEHGDCCGHDHHDHHHGHSHGDHDAADHDHAWAPWRYVVLLVPVILFLLGFPNKGPSVQATSIDLPVDTSKQATASASWVALGPTSWEQLLLIHGAHLRRSTGNERELDFRDAMSAAEIPESRKRFAGQRVKLRGQFVPNRGGNQVFSVARFKMNCCAGDATQQEIFIVSSEPISQVSPNDWILVTGEIDFIQNKGDKGFRTILRIQGKEDVKKTSPDPNPYI